MVRFDWNITAPVLQSTPIDGSPASLAAVPGATKVANVGGVTAATGNIDSPADAMIVAPSRATRARVDQSPDVTFRNKTLTAKGLGAYIAQAFSATDAGHVARVLAGVTVMSLYVVGVNRLVWRPLYGLAERRYKLD